jgi:hypothetical protein
MVKAVAEHIEALDQLCRRSMYRVIETPLAGKGLPN